MATAVETQPELERRQSARYPNLVLTFSTHVSRVDMPPGTSAHLASALEELIDRVADSTNLSFTIGVQGSDVELLMAHPRGRKLLQRLNQTENINFFQELYSASQPFIAPELFSEQIHYGAQAFERAGLRMSPVGLLPLHAVHSLATHYRTDEGLKRLNGVEQLLSNNWRYLLLARREPPRGIQPPETESVVRIREHDVEMPIILSHDELRRSYMDYIVGERNLWQTLSYQQKIVEADAKRGRPYTVLHAPLEEGIFDKDRRERFLSYIDGLNRLHGKALDVTGFAIPTLRATDSFLARSLSKLYLLDSYSAEEFEEQDSWGPKISAVRECWHVLRPAQKKAALLALDASYRYAAAGKGNPADCEGQKTEADHLFYCALNPLHSLTDLSDLPEKQQGDFLFARMKSYQRGFTI